MNTPSTLGINWKWRMKDGEFTNELRDNLRELTKLYGRSNIKKYFNKEDYMLSNICEKITTRQSRIAQTRKFTLHS